VCASTGLWLGLLQRRVDVKPLRWIVSFEFLQQLK
jgi:hypothetical protein